MHFMNSNIGTEVEAAFKYLNVKPELGSLGLAETGNVDLLRRAVRAITVSHNAHFAQQCGRATAD
jgi:hypothetical protein